MKPVKIIKDCWRDWSNHILRFWGFSGFGGGVFGIIGILNTYKEWFWKKNINRNLMLCWPCYEDPIASRCLKYFRGKYVIYIGESEGGCCATDKFFKILQKDYLKVKEISIPQWNGMHDYVSIYKKRKEVKKSGKNRV